MKGVFMDTMTYAAFAAFRGYVAEEQSDTCLLSRKGLKEVQALFASKFADRRKTPLSNIIHPNLLLWLHPISVA
jgi:hypothetical protein